MEVLDLEKRQKFSIDEKYTYYAGGMAIDREQAIRVLQNNDRLCRDAQSGRISENDYIAGAVCVSYKNNETGEKSFSFANLEMFEKFDPLKNVVVSACGIDIRIEGALLDALSYLLQLDEHQWNKGTSQWFWYPSNLSYYTEMDRHSIGNGLVELRDKISSAINREIDEYAEMERLAETISRCAQVFGLQPQREYLPENRKDYDDNGTRANLLRKIASAHKFLIETYRFLTKECRGAVIDEFYCDKTKFREVAPKLFVLADEAQTCFDELSRAFNDAMGVLPEKTKQRLRDEEMERSLMEAEKDNNEE